MGETESWVEQHAHPIASLDPSAPLTDLAGLVVPLGAARVVGLGGSTRGAHEVCALKHRVVRVLVERLGFRSLALDDDSISGGALDHYVCTGAGDPRALLADAWQPWRTEEMLAVIRWLRAFNEAHPDDMARVVGVKVDRVGSRAYDAVLGEIARVAPGLAAEVERRLAPLRPAGSVEEHIEWVRGQTDKERLVDEAAAVCGLIEALPADDRSSALLHARAILGFFTYHVRRGADRVIAETIAQWHDHTEAGVVYWGANSHTSRGDSVTLSLPPSRGGTLRNTGSYLADRFGAEYRSILFSFHHGSISHGDPRPVPATPDEFLEAPLSGTASPMYWVDLREDQPDAVRSWLATPGRTRFIGPQYRADHDVDYHMAGGSLAEWFDVIVHCQTVTPLRRLR